MLPALVAATLVLPGAGGLAGRWPWVGLIAFRGLIAALALILSVALALGALLFRRRRRLRTVLIALATVGVVMVAGQVTVLAVRGLFPVAPVGAAPTNGLTVVVTNTEHSGADPDALAKLFLSVGADVVAMPETDATLAGPVSAMLAAAGHPVQLFGVAAQNVSAGGRYAQITPTSLLVSDRLGRYRQVNADGNDFGEVRAEPVGRPAGRPTFVAVHPQAPVGSALVRIWRTGTTEAIASCRDSANEVLGGDFNSTIDHPALRAPGGCFDAARRMGAAAMATWPQGLPRILGAPLDHVFATTAQWHAIAVWVAPIPGSDHRALLTRLLPVSATTDVPAWSG